MTDVYIEAGLYAYLAADDGVKNLVDDRIYPLRVPQQQSSEPQKRPCVVYTVISESRSATFCETISLVSIAVQIDMYALRYLDVKELAKRVKEAMVDYTGLMGDTHVSRVRLDTGFDFYEQDPGLYRVSYLFTIWYQET